MLLVIAVLASLTIAVIAVFFMGRNSDVARRVATLDPGGAASKTVAGDIVKRMFTDADRSKLGSRFVEAGWYRTTAVMFYTWAAIGFAVALALLLALILHMGWTSPTMYAAVVAGSMLGALAPNFVLNRAIKERKIRIQETLPDWLDMVSTTVEAGIALNGALAMSLESLTGPLLLEMREVLADVKMGRSRSEALTAMADRVKQMDLTSTVMAMVQTEKLGGNIGKVLDELAADSRHRRLMRAEEIAAQMPVKMAIPMALFMLPALVVIIFVPVVSDMWPRLTGLK